MHAGGLPGGGCGPGPAKVMAALTTGAVVEQKEVERSVWVTE